MGRRRPARSPRRSASGCTRPPASSAADVRIKVDNGPLAVGTLGKLDGAAVELGLRIVEVAAVPDAVPVVGLAAGSAPSASPFEEEVTLAAAAAARAIAGPACRTAQHRRMAMRS